MNVRVGTSGYSYPEWKGNFYPEKIAAGDMLGFYAGRFPTVEINNTFYRMPKEPLLQGWAAQVPESFTFVLKASQRITHIKRLKECGELLAFLFGTTAVFHRGGTRARKSTSLGRSFFMLGGSCTNVGPSFSPSAVAVRTSMRLACASDAIEKTRGSNASHRPQLIP